MSRVVARRPCHGLMEHHVAQISGVRRRTVCIATGVHWNRWMVVGDHGAREWMQKMRRNKRKKTQLTQSIKLDIFIHRYSECSRSCGGGAQFITRECNAPEPTNGGKYCVGARIKYKSCNTHSCPPGSLDAREEQCRELDNNNFDIVGIHKNVKWVPKYGGKHQNDKLLCLKELFKHNFPYSQLHRLTSANCIVEFIRPIIIFFLKIRWDKMPETCMALMEELWWEIVCVCGFRWKMEPHVHRRASTSASMGYAVQLDAIMFCTQQQSWVWHSHYLMQRKGCIAHSVIYFWIF